MLLIGYLYGIPSERRLEEEVKVNLAFRWFLGLGLEDKVPDHSTISQNRRRRFKDSTVFQDIFDHIVQLCIEKGLVTGEIVVVDSTHIKTYASPEKVEKVQIDKKPSDYLIQLEDEVKKIEENLQRKREVKGYKKRGVQRQIKKNIRK
ncbi:Transposase domain [Thermoflavimicrobium dichotomicum]|uniref:Transposase domain n=2 Tax=Thermoflavimicrobium dichotomicum TaxID=46223 RepID=A0A1I3PMT6_9BACL|nr:Transposase domain [Thermoflavimicrobium dichotomicum]